MPQGLGSAEPSASTQWDPQARGALPSSPSPCRDGEKDAPLADAAVLAPIQLQAHGLWSLGTLTRLGEPMGALAEQEGDPPALHGTPAVPATF